MKIVSLVFIVLLLLCFPLHAKNIFVTASAKIYSDEIEEAKNFKVNVILNDSKSLNIYELVSLIKNSSYVVSNDTGPAHICAHLNKRGVVLFGSHTSPEKVSIETENFKAIKVNDLIELNVSDVFEKIKDDLN